jgi:hypothetical protein
VGLVDHLEAAEAATAAAAAAAAAAQTAFKQQNKQLPQGNVHPTLPIWRT